ncbi:CU044_2847 family protein [Streptomyces sp. NK08204]|uniref:CU044_2847 family protein n=1 Tax=Streptomyces sp. NK08204 TaxID=2873260 RepID=UPI001CED916F|nr:CU044_2847 family protein [Streptomyces sp. NK08204]
MDEELDAGGETVVPVEIDGQKVLLAIGPGGRKAASELGEEEEIGWRRPRLEPVLDGLTAVARAMGTRLRQTGASKATVEFGCDVSFDTGQFLAVVGKASSRSTWKVTLEWTAPEAPGA